MTVAYYDCAIAHIAFNCTDVTAPTISFLVVDQAAFTFA